MCSNCQTEGNAFLITYAFHTSWKIHNPGLTGPTRSYQFNPKILRKIYGCPEQFFTLNPFHMDILNFVLKRTHQLSSAGDTTSLKDWHYLISTFRSSCSPTTEHFGSRNFPSSLKEKLRQKTKTGRGANSRTQCKLVWKFFNSFNSYYIPTTCGHLMLKYTHDSVSVCSSCLRFLSVTSLSCWLLTVFLLWPAGKLLPPFFFCFHYAFYD